jgi:hypothetical protein
MKEYILIAAVIASLFLIISTFKTLNKLPFISRVKKTVIVYTTLIVPIIGAIWVAVLKRRSIQKL